MSNRFMGGKSEHERTRWWVTPTRPNTPKGTAGGVGVQVNWEIRHEWIR